MDLSTFKLLEDAARLGSFSAVARAHGMDPSAVSRLIAGVETEIGVRLFERTTRKVALTEAGEIYLARVAPLVDEIAGAGEEAAAGIKAPSGTLRMTASVAFGERCLAPLLPAFTEAYPDVAIDLVLDDRPLDLVAERIDLGIRLGPDVEGAYIVSKLMPTRYRVCASPDYLARHARVGRALESPTDLPDHDCVVFALPAYRNFWRFRDAGGIETDVPIRSHHALSNALCVRAAVLAGAGPALLADWLVDEDLADGRLVDVFPGFDVAAAAFDTAAWILYPSRPYLPAKVRAAIDFLKRSLPRTRSGVGAGALSRACP